MSELKSTTSCQCPNCGNQLTMEIKTSVELHGSRKTTDDISRMYMEEYAPGFSNPKSWDEFNRKLYKACDVARNKAAHHKAPENFTNATAQKLLIVDTVQEMLSLSQSDIVNVKVVLVKNVCNPNKDIGGRLYYRSDMFGWMPIDVQVNKSHDNAQDIPLSSKITSQGILLVDTIAEMLQLDVRNSIGHSLALVKHAPNIDVELNGQLYIHRKNRIGWMLADEAIVNHVKSGMGLIKEKKPYSNAPGDTSVLVSNDGSKGVISQIVKNGDMPKSTIFNQPPIESPYYPYPYPFPPDSPTAIHVVDYHSEMLNLDDKYKVDMQLVLVKNMPNEKGEPEFSRLYRYSGNEKCWVAVSNLEKKPEGTDATDQAVKTALNPLSRKECIDLTNSIKHANKDVKDSSAVKKVIAKSDAKTNFFVDDKRQVEIATALEKFNQEKSTKPWCHMLNEEKIKFIQDGVAKGISIKVLATSCKTNVNTMYTFIRRKKLGDTILKLKPRRKVSVKTWSTASINERIELIKCVVADVTKLDTVAQEYKTSCNVIRRATEAFKEGKSITKYLSRKWNKLRELAKKNVLINAYNQSLTNEDVAHEYNVSVSGLEAFRKKHNLRLRDFEKKVREKVDANDFLEGISRAKEDEKQLQVQLVEFDEMLKEKFPGYMRTEKVKQTLNCSQEDIDAVMSLSDSIDKRLKFMHPFGPGSMSIFCIDESLIEILKSRKQ